MAETEKMGAPKRTFIAGKMYEVCTYEQFQEHQSYYERATTAIQCTIDGTDYVLPFRNKPVTEPGIYRDGNALDFFYTPSEKDLNKDDYLAENIIDFGSAESMRDMIALQDQIRNTQYEILTNPDNIFTPYISPEDDPAMKALKEAIIEKHIDMDLYAPRFGKNYNNDRRLKESITLMKLIRICNNLDIKATLTLSDENKDVPNPIGKSITVTLTTPQKEEDEQDDE